MLTCFSTIYAPLISLIHAHCVGVALICANPNAKTSAHHPQAVRSTTGTHIGVIKEQHKLQRLNPP